MTIACVWRLVAATSSPVASPLVSSFRVGPTRLDFKIEKGGPRMASGLVVRDLSARGLENVGVAVDDFEASPSAVRFVARSVEAI